MERKKKEEKNKSIIENLMTMLDNFGSKESTLEKLEWCCKQ